jgi:hypothetical protein
METSSVAAGHAGERNPEMKKLLAVITAGVLLVSMAVPAFADNTGYEGQPGNQSSGGGGNNGSNSNNPPPGN